GNQRQTALKDHRQKEQKGHGEPDGREGIGDGYAKESGHGIRRQVYGEAFLSRMGRVCKPHKIGAILTHIGVYLKWPRRIKSSQMPRPLCDPASTLSPPTQRQQMKARRQPPRRRFPHPSRPDTTGTYIPPRPASGAG